MVYASKGCMCVFVSDQKLCTQRHLHTVQFTQQFMFNETMLEKLALLAVEILNSMNLNMLKQ